MSGGFDLIIGNPPYGREQVDLLKKVGFEEISDIYTAFIIKGLTLLKEKGLLGFIVPVSWQTGENYLKFREKLFSLGQPFKIINLPFDVFEDAYVDTCIIIIKKGKTQNFGYYSYPKNISSNKLIDIDKKIVEIPTSKIFEDKLKKIFPNISISSFLEKFRTNNFVELGPITKSAIGILASKYKIVDYKEKSFLPFFIGNIYRYKEDRRGFKFIDFNQHKSAYIDYYKGKRILVRRIVNRQDRLMSTIVEDDFVSKKDLYSFKTIDNNYDIKYILALLNSKLFSYLYINTSTISTKDDFRQTTLSELRRLPIKKTSYNEQKTLIILVDKLLALNKKLNNLKTDEEIKIEVEIKKIENEIDRKVYSLYNLTQDEIKIVEECLPR